MAKKKPANGYWNYRVVTKKHINPLTFEEYRVFDIAECYYNKNDELEGYSEKREFFEWDRIKDMKSTHKLIGKAFLKPVIDLDRFPKEFKNEKRRTQQKAGNS